MKHVSLTLFLIMTLSLIAACGGGSADEPTAASTTSTETSTASTATSTAASTTPTTTAESATTTAVSAEAATEVAETPAAETGSVPGGPVASGAFAYGFNIAWRGDDNRGDFNQRAREMTQSAGFNWVRIQLQWSEIERGPNQWDPLPVDRIVEEYQGSGVKILASVVKPPEWALDPSGESLLADFSDWEGFMHFLAERYKGKIHAWEIWNEQNLALEMGGEVRLDDYAKLLESGYRGVKKADPEAIVVFGGLTPNGVNDPTIAIDDVHYLENFYNYQGGYYTQFFDVMGIHVSATNNGPDLMYPDNPGTGDWADDPSFYFRRAEQLRQVMVEFADFRPIWVTEFGWTTENQAAGYEYGADNSEQDQAEYLVRAFEIATEEWDWVGGMFVWNLNFSVLAPETDEKYPWSVLYSDWSPRPSFTALQQMPKQ